MDDLTICTFIQPLNRFSGRYKLITSLIYTVLYSSSLPAGQPLLQDGLHHPSPSPVVPPVTHRAIRVRAIYIITIRYKQAVTAGLGIVHEALDTEGLAQLGDGLAGLEHVGAGQLERFVGDSDTRRTPPHPHVVLARNFPSRSLPIALPYIHGLKRRKLFVQLSISHYTVNIKQFNDLVTR